MGIKLIKDGNTLVRATSNTLITKKIGNDEIYGYRIKRGKKVINRKQAKVIEIIFNLALDGYTDKAIAEILNEKGIKSVTGKTYTGGMVAHYLKEIRYIGINDYPPIINKEVFFKVNNITEYIDKTSKSTNN